LMKIVKIFCNDISANNIEAAAGTTHADVQSIPALAQLRGLIIFTI